MNNNVYEVIKERIVTLDYGPGYILNESDIANEFGLSRTPVREAFKKLQNDNLLNVVPRIGAQVAQIDFKHIKSVFEVEKVLDVLCTKLALQRANEDGIKKLEEVIESYKQHYAEMDYDKVIKDDSEFHRIMRELAQNPVLSGILDGLHTQLERLWYYTQNRVTNIYGFTDTYVQIVNAMKEKDEEKAERYALIHIESYIKQIKNDLL